MPTPPTLDRANRQRHAALQLERRALAEVLKPGRVRAAFAIKRAAARCHHLADLTMARLEAATTARRAA